MLPRLAIFRLRQPSLVRGIALSLGALATTMLLAGWPDLDKPHETSWQIVPVLLSLWGLAETGRCLKRKWSLYHAGVLILIYSSLMILACAVFFWLYL